MEAVGKSLLQLLKELQPIPSLNDFYLAGGTSLAIRLNHRKSQDIDLFSDKCVGIAG
ncbi:nucleotidyl transferase AbiEii/AbiGii toxin family protein [Arachidicoccus sp.]|uniref:nucleotidyl transferase AbiEii/AbiGii toxin family protein n=1 Tax=Arachidicoccus sp. TaxID=1872624 RepID=UPI003D1A606B